MSELRHQYFRRLAATVRLCPGCGARTRFEQALDPDSAYEMCDACGWVATRTAPWPSGLAPDPEPSLAEAVAEANRILGHAPRDAEVIEFRPRG